MEDTEDYTAESTEAILSFTQAKKARQESEEQMQLLANRLALLRLEEERANKKIEETRKRAREILEARIRNQEAQQRKEEERRARQREEELKAESNRLMKAESRQSKEAVRAQLIQRLKDSASQVKRDKESFQELIQEKKLKEIEENTIRAQHSKNASKDAKLRVVGELEARRAVVREEQKRRVEEELRIRREKEEEVARMEQEELELIQRLQDTQMMHRSALEELESAMASNKDMCPVQLLSMSTSSQRPASRSPHK